MLCGEIISVYCESRSKHANTPYGQNGELPNTSLLVLGDPGRLDTLIYVVTVERRWREQARHSHVHSKRGNLKKWLLQPSGGCPWNSNVPPHSITCHLLAVCGTPPWECDIWIGRTSTVKVHRRCSSSRVAILRYSHLQISIPKVSNLPQISAIAIPHPTKFHIQGQWEISILSETESQYLQIVPVDRSERTDRGPYAHIGIRVGEQAQLRSE